MISRAFFITTSVVVTTLLGSTALAQQGIRPFVGARYTVDTNFFRTANEAEAIQQTGSSDTEVKTYRLFAGIDALIPVSRQRFNLSAQVDMVDYDPQARLEHTDVDARGDWDWQLGNLWSGTAGLGYRKRLTEFDESGEPVRDIVNTKNLGLTARFQFHPDWAVVGGIGSEKTKHDVEATDALTQAQNDDVKLARSRLDNTQGFFSGEVQYATTANTKVGFRAVRSDGEFDRDASPDFEETELSGVVYWEATGKSALEARLGQTDRDVNGDKADFKGSTGRFTYKWLITEKTNLDFTASRETRLVNESTRFSVEEGWGVSALWNATAKLRFRGSYRDSKDDFQGSGSAREDDLIHARVAVIYAATRVVTLTGSFVYRERSSNENEFNFDTTISSIEAKLALR